MVTTKRPTSAERGAVNRASVLAYIQREADLDGVSTINSVEAAAVLGVSQAPIRDHVYRLAEQGVLSIVEVQKGVGFTLLLSEEYQ